ncbi:LacI family DNA-binding transcriptional regulator [Brachybacterium sp. J144]|uniref:LacI family DNA-binding transcriptional regulator n=1 Tax=Brachybacterium sp. J144 TaxID=3116487 RepID=UPI002E75A608|nr:LacI family DNA-binding transcriptional regulator [Brachybacterium sp. J144]MEE1650449.1 LacI family DNA-binding transcriptional regulator [Brachybacterium sp. J144]
MVERTPPQGPSRLPTMKDIAEHVGVSRQLVSLVLRGADGPSTESREKVLAAAAELGYRPNASARLLRQARTRTLGVVFSMRNAFQVRYVEELVAAASARGYRVALGTVDAGRGTDEAIGALLEERVEALAVFNPDPRATALAAASTLLPAVLLGEWTRDDSLDTVHVDERGGLRQAVEHLVGLGHREIAYVGGPLGGLVGADRADAYRAAMTQAGLEGEVDVLDAGFGEEDGASAGRTLLEREQLPTAVVCGSDHAAAGLLAVLQRARVRVPAEVSVIGFDDSHVAALSYHALTSVHQDVAATVEATLSILLERLEGTSDGARARRVVATPTRLTVRGSTGTVRAGR